MLIEAIRRNYRGHLSPDDRILSVFPLLSAAINSMAISGGIPSGIPCHFRLPARHLSACDWPNGKRSISMSPQHKRAERLGMCHEPALILPRQYRNGCSLVVPALPASHRLGCGAALASRLAHGLQLRLDQKR
jgi:hypothetical protein